MTNSLLDQPGLESTRSPWTTQPSSEELQAYAQATARKYGLDPAISARQGGQESGHQHWDSSGNVITSPAGALGYMQLMPQTAKALGVNPNDPYQNIEGGLRYQRQMLDAFGGDQRKATAAYNAGPGGVQQAIQAGGANWEAALPGETQQYLASILGGGAASKPKSAWEALQAYDSGQQAGGYVGSQFAQPTPAPSNRISPPGVDPAVHPQDISPPGVDQSVHPDALRGTYDPNIDPITGAPVGADYGPATEPQSRASTFLQDYGNGNPIANVANTSLPYADQLTRGVQYNLEAPYNAITRPALRAAGVNTDVPDVVANAATEFVSRAAVPQTVLDAGLTVGPGNLMKVARGALGLREVGSGVRGAEQVLSIINNDAGAARKMYDALKAAGHTDEEIAGAFGQTAIDLAKGGRPSAQAVAATTELTGQAQSRAARNVYERTLEATGDPGTATEAARKAAGAEAGATTGLRNTATQLSERMGPGVVEPKKTTWTITNAAGEAKQVELDLPHGFQDTGSPEAALERLAQNHADQQALNDSIRADEAGSRAAQARQGVQSIRDAARGGNTLITGEQAPTSVDEIASALSAEADRLAASNTPGEKSLAGDVAAWAKRFGDPASEIRRQLQQGGGEPDTGPGVSRKAKNFGEAAGPGSDRVKSAGGMGEIALRQGPKIDESLHELSHGLEVNPDAIGLQAPEELSRRMEVWRAGSKSKNMQEPGRIAAQEKAWEMIDSGANPAAIVNDMSDAYAYLRGATPRERGFISEMQRIQEKLTSDLGGGETGVNWNAVRTEAEGLAARGDEAFNVDFRRAAEAERQAARAEPAAQRAAKQAENATAQEGQQAERDAWVEANRANVVASGAETEAKLKALGDLHISRPLPEPGTAESGSNNLLGRAWNEVVGGTGVPISLKSSLSPPLLRQGLARVVTNPVAAFREFGTSMKAMVNEQFARSVQKAIEEDPWIRETKEVFIQGGGNKGYTWKDVGGQILDWGGQAGKDTRPEELAGFAVNDSKVGQLAERLTVHSNRQAAVELNLHRTNWYRETASKMWDAGVRDVKDYTELRKTIEQFTGRGSVAQPSKLPFFFSTRALSGRAQSAWRGLDAMAHAPDMFKPGARQEAGKAVVGYIGAGTAFLGGSYLAAKQAGLDPQIEFKDGLPTLRVGAEHFDPWAGGNTIAKFGFGVAKDLVKAAGNGDLADVPQTAISDIASRSGRFLRGSLSPYFGKIADTATGTDYLGKPYNLAQDVTSGGFASDLATPFVAESLIDAFKADGIVGAAAQAVPAFLSMGGGSYNTTTELRNDAARKLGASDYASASPLIKAQIEAQPEVKQATQGSPSDYQQRKAAVVGEIDTAERTALDAFKAGTNQMKITDIWHDLGQRRLQAAKDLSSQFAEQFKGFDKSKYETALQGYYDTQKTFADGTPDFDTTDKARQDYIGKLPADQQQWIKEAQTVAEGKKTPERQKYDQYIEAKKQLGYMDIKPDDPKAAEKRKALDAANPEIDLAAWYYSGTSEKAGAALSSPAAADKALALNLPNRPVKIDGYARPVNESPKVREVYDGTKSLITNYEASLTNPTNLDAQAARLYSKKFDQLTEPSQRAAVHSAITRDLQQGHSDLDAVLAFFGKNETLASDEAVKYLKQMIDHAGIVDPAKDKILQKVKR